jgi:hypothetical protein
MPVVEFTAVKKIPDVITEHELQLAFNEGKKGYHDGKRRGYNPYVDIGHDDLATAWWDGWDSAKRYNYMRNARRIFYTPIRYAYHIWGLISDAMERYNHRNDPPLPPLPCPICGKPGHKAKYCPNTRDLGF